MVYPKILEAKWTRPTESAAYSYNFTIKKANFFKSHNSDNTVLNLLVSVIIVHKIVGWTLSTCSQTVPSLSSWGMPGNHNELMADQQTLKH